MESAAVLALWLLWVAYWVRSSRAVKPVMRKESEASRRYQSIPMIAGGLLVALPDLGLPVFDARYLASGQPALFAAALAIVVAGLLFTVWARVFLGNNWSVSVTLKTGHELVRGGPYALVRHPIYTGGLLAIAGSALAGGQWRGLLGLALVAGSLIYKIKLEERWLGEHFGNPYAQYQADVPALIPLVF